MIKGIRQSWKTRRIPVIDNKNKARNKEERDEN